MADEVRVVTRTGYGKRIGNAIAGVLVGLIMVVVSFPLLFLNEERSVKTYRSLKEGQRAVVSVASDQVEGANEGKLVHLSGEAITTATLADPVFGLSVKAIKLIRKVEMYQWREKKRSQTKKNMGGSEETETTYSYSKGWSDDLIESGEFREKDGHQNPAGMPVSGETFTADDVTVGAFALSGSLVGQMGGAQDLAVDQAPDRVRPIAGKPVSRTGTGYYIGKDAAQPEVGDLRVAFTAVYPQTVSLLARQAGNDLAGYQTQAGGVIERIELGTKSSAEMFRSAFQENTIMTWLLRALGFALMFIGFLMIFKPLSVLADVVPFLGSLAGIGTGILAFSLAASLSLLTIAVAWIVLRPWFGAVLLAVAVAVFFLLFKKKKPKVAAA